MDLSNGYENIASDYIFARNKFSSIGESHVREWAESLNVHSKVLDLGCGSGVPVTQAILKSGHSLFAIDASRTMIRALEQSFPNVKAKCEAVEQSDFFEEEFDGIVLIGVIFLLEELIQLAMIQKVGESLRPEGRFLFSAPIETGKWQEAMTGTECTSLGKDRYVSALASAGMKLVNTFSDEGDNNHYSAIKLRKKDQC